MPIYEYLCSGCGESHDALQKISDAPLVDCPACQAPGLKKAVTAPAFRLKGGGWYETDFKTGPKKNLAGNDKESNAAPAKSEKAAAKDNTPTTKKSSTTDKK